MLRLTDSEGSPEFMCFHKKYYNSTGVSSLRLHSVRREHGKKCVEAAHNEGEKDAFSRRILHVPEARVDRLVAYLHMREKTLTSLLHHLCGATAMQYRASRPYRTCTREVSGCTGLGVGLSADHDLPEKGDQDRMSQREVPKTWPSLHSHKRQTRGCVPTRFRPKGSTNSLNLEESTCRACCLEGKSFRYARGYHICA